MENVSRTGASMGEMPHTLRLRLSGLRSYFHVDVYAWCTKPSVPSNQRNRAVTLHHSALPTWSHTSKKKKKKKKKKCKTSPLEAISIMKRSSRNRHVVCLIAAQRQRHIVSHTLISIVQLARSKGASGPCVGTILLCLVRHKRAAVHPVSPIVRGVVSTVREPPSCALCCSANADMLQEALSRCSIFGSKRETAMTTALGDTRRRA
ncbi:hypothetical protein J3F83DRAFT_409807 [Trichoderma novae-zelandiae]